jgi:hypothetical protein
MADKDTPARRNVPRQPDSEAARAGYRDSDEQIDNAPLVEDDDAVNFDEVDDLEDSYDEDDELVDGADLDDDDEIDDLEDEDEGFAESSDQESSELRKRWDRP